MKQLCKRVSLLKYAGTLEHFHSFACVKSIAPRGKSGPCKGAACGYNFVLVDVTEDVVDSHCSVPRRARDDLYRLRFSHDFSQALRIRFCRIQHVAQCFRHTVGDPDAGVSSLGRQGQNWAKSRQVKQYCTFVSSATGISFSETSAHFFWGLAHLVCSNCIMFNNISKISYSSLTLKKLKFVTVIRKHVSQRRKKQNHANLSKFALFELIPVFFISIKLFSMHLK